ncbi:hypothetical protein IEQ34_025253 [Dendrobium chrysotoxum]|uniref:ERCC4 domain-containing protein n=1 Tax=Dendrobium chrysotoxum TaxID=161865 RepID=A0AAV7FQQ8_DENCH|nr:hypothetical protein IEQ34_025253 [Dendrobium chrysotoxum]
MGLSPLQTVLTQLRIRRVELWPRFHKAVIRDLGRKKATVIELHQPLSQAMRRIQNAIVECLDATLGELKRGSGSVDIEDATIENAIFRAFEAIVRRQLDPVWHRIGPKTKRLVSDLHDLRQILTFLLSYDAVKFHQYLETVLGSQIGASNTSAIANKTQSPWLMMDAANVIFTEAKARVFVGEVKKQQAAPAPNGNGAAEGFDEDEEEAAFGSTRRSNNSDRPRWLPPGIEPTLEELPKWHLLRERILSTMRNSVLGQRGKEGRPGRKLMERQLRHYFEWKTDFSRMSSNLRNPTFASTSAQQAQTNQQNNGQPNGVNGRQNSQYESEALKRKEIWEGGRAPLHKRRRQRGGAVLGTSSTRRNPGNASENLETEAGDVAQFMRSIADQTDDGGENELDEAAASSAIAEHFTEVEFDSFFGLLKMEDLIVVRPYSQDDDDHHLQELKPRFSVEEQKYLSELRREKESFERLIHEKARMALPLQADGRAMEESADERLLRTINSRLAGGQQSATKEPPRVIVDMREFRSSLPFMLHKAGMRVIPCTLQVGDYILSSTMCVERKSLSDLIQSFNSGRLYTQCELMSVHYQHPILLIEFDQGKSFSLQTMNESKSGPRALTSRVKPNELDIQSKLVLLTNEFHRLRIIWSSSPYETSSIFAELKQNYEEPDESRVAAIGLDGEQSDAANAGVGGIDNSYNLTPQDVLLALPGITTKNYRLISNSVRDLCELCELTRDELSGLIAVSYHRLALHLLAEGGERRSISGAKANGRPGISQHGALPELDYGVASGKRAEHGVNIPPLSACPTLRAKRCKAADRATFVQRRLLGSGHFAGRAARVQRNSALGGPVHTKMRHFSKPTAEEHGPSMQSQEAGQGPAYGKDALVISDAERAPQQGEQIGGGLVGKRGVTPRAEPDASALFRTKNGPENTVQPTASRPFQMLQSTICRQPSLGQEPSISESCARLWRWRATQSRLNARFVRENRLVPLKAPPLTTQLGPAKKQLQIRSASSVQDEQSLGIVTRGSGDLGPPWLATPSHGTAMVRRIRP